jgi:hypothetical protein
MDKLVGKVEETHSSQTVDHVFRDFVAGMYNEAKTNPGKLAVEAGVGLGLTAATFAAGIFIAPEVLVGAAALGTVAGLYELGKGAMNLAEQSRIVDNSNHQFTAQEINQAHLQIRNMGANTIDSLAVLAGGIAAIEGYGIRAGIAPIISRMSIRQGSYAAGTASYAHDWLSHHQPKTVEVFSKAAKITSRVMLEK